MCSVEVGNFPDLERFWNSGCRTNGFGIPAVDFGSWEPIKTEIYSRRSVIGQAKQAAPKSQRNPLFAYYPYVQSSIAAVKHFRKVEAKRQRAVPDLFYLTTDILVARS